ncbi:MAG: hypothetical protein JXB46_09855, partial [Candidatus Eisenbacteria bacterium]|nr:hypothetical protein [Candidatus Eisenbacteria bacterium]
MLRGRVLLCCLASLSIVLPGCGAPGNQERPAAGPATAGKLIRLTWYNCTDPPFTREVSSRGRSGGSTTPQAKNDIAHELEWLLEAEITLLGAGGSSARMQLEEIFRPNNEEEEPPRDYASEGESMPDVFPFGTWCTVGFRRRDITSETCAALTTEEIARFMPGLASDMTDIARELGITPAELWRTYEHDDVLYALPRDPSELLSGTAFPTAILWRGDYLDEMGLPPPGTIDEWDHALRGFREIHPDAVPWVSPMLPVGELSGLVPASGSREHTIAFFPLYGAAGIHPGLIERRETLHGTTLEPWWTNPMLREVLAVLEEWHTAGLIEATTMSRPEIGRLAMGRCLVVDGVPYHRGDWVTVSPLSPGSAAAVALSLDISARIVVGPAPLFPGVDLPVVPVNREMVASDSFAFAKKNEDEPERLHRIMRIVDTIAHNESAFLLAYYGREGEHWEW